MIGTPDVTRRSPLPDRQSARLGRGSTSRRWFAAALSAAVLALPGLAPAAERTKATQAAPAAAAPQPSQAAHGAPDAKPATRSAQAAAATGQRHAYRRGDLRHCLGLGSNEAITRCAEGG
jgi:hypothetical protein